MYHIPVLLNECIDGLRINPDGVYVDTTFGGGGHSESILKHLKNGRLIAFDQDDDACLNKIDDKRFVLVNHNFKYLKNFLQLYKAIPVDGILCDLGISSHQIDNAERGFSIRFDGPLDLRMDRNLPTTACDLVNNSSVEFLKELFYSYGEISNAPKLSSTITEYRKHHQIKTIYQFKEAISGCVLKGQYNKYYAQVFQALRIEVNKEFESLKEMLQQTIKLLKPGGRLVIISYHSLEDRIAKNFLKSGNFPGKIEKDFYGNPVTPFKLITKKPIVPETDEIEKNSRSRSAKLRIGEKK